MLILLSRQSIARRLTTGSLADRTPPGSSFGCAAASLLRIGARIPLTGDSAGRETRPRRRSPRRWTPDSMAACRAAEVPGLGTPAHGKEV